jgi:Peptidase family M1 domain
VPLRRRAAALALAATLGAACSGTPGPFADTRTPASTGSRGPSGGTGSVSCPAAYAQPDPKRPRIAMTFDLADDLATVRGTERVVFTPDLPVTELVFRLTPNAPMSVAAGSRIQVTAATADPSGGPFQVQPAGAAPGAQGGLLVVPLGRRVPPGEQVTAELAFTLTLGRRAFDRFGHLDAYAWWGSGQPLLAWERGVGWHTEPLLSFVGESATSEAAAVDLTVTAPARYTALTSGVQDPPADTGNGRRRWHAVADRARDVSVAVGPFRVATKRVGETDVVVGTPRQTPPEQLLMESERAVRELSRRYGPAPFPVVNLARLPLEGGGIEYPGSILMLDDSRLVTVHEVAHQWFYGMVGNSQARDPWLDEAFASWAQAEVDGTANDAALRLPGRVGAPAADFRGNEGGYFTTVYAKGAAALTAARTAAGPARFDAAVRCYVNANAWRIARPADLARALAGLPKAVAVLRQAGALP